MNNNFQQEEIVKLVKWSSEYPEMWSKIWEEDHTLPAKECIGIIESLEQHSLHVLIPLLLYRHRHSNSVNRALNRFIIDGITKVWEEEGTNAICRSLKEKLAE